MISDIRRNLSLRPARVRWDLVRFGLTPGKLRRRGSDAAPAPVLCLSMPKAGTHLLERLLCLHPDYWRPLVPTIYESGDPEFERIAERRRPGAVYLSHAAHRVDHEQLLRGAGIRLATIIRDPRDVALSAAHYRARKSHGFGATYAGRSLHERIELTIRGDPALRVRPLRDQIERHLGWIEAADAVVRFEQLVGSEPERRRAISGTLAKLGAPSGEEVVGRISRALVSSASPTFRSGISGGWSEHFDPSLEQLLHDELGDRLAAYGYAEAAA